MIEIGIVMSIVSILLALVLGLAPHVNAIAKIRRAQADLGEWHESLNRWFLQFGEYPHARIDTTSPNDPIELLTSPSAIISDITYSDERANLTTLTNDTASAGCYVRFVLPNGSFTNITFRSFLTTAVSTVDPWGTPYIYLPTDNAKSYTLFSCGPNRETTDIPPGADAKTSLDDIHFER